MTETTKVKSTDQANSCLKKSSNVRSCIDFKSMWKSHPLNWEPPENAPFRKETPKPKKKKGNTPFDVLLEEEDPPGDPIYENQCAIKMSIALQGAGVSLDTYPKNRSEVRYVRQLQKKIRGALAAEELAIWLSRAIGNPEPAYKNGEALKKIKGRTGVVFFKDYWQRTPNGALDGDHIDLWDGKTTPGQSSTYYEGYVTAFDKAAEVWFWEIK